MHVHHEVSICFSPTYTIENPTHAHTVHKGYSAGRVLTLFPQAELDSAQLQTKIHTSHLHLADAFVYKDLQ